MTEEEKERIDTKAVEEKALNYFKTFIEDSKTILQSWNGWVNQHNKHLTAEELTEENLDKEIDSVGSRWGMDIMKRYQRLDWLTIATNSGMCKIYIA